jgi:hypothetical protein
MFKVKGPGLCSNCDERQFIDDEGVCYHCRVMEYCENQIEVAREAARKVGIKR